MGVSGAGGGQDGWVGWTGREKVRVRAGQMGRTREKMWWCCAVVAFFFFLKEKDCENGKIGDFD